MDQVFRRGGDYFITMTRWSFLADVLNEGRTSLEVEYPGAIERATMGDLPVI